MIIYTHEQGYEILDRMREQERFIEEFKRLPPREQEVLVFRYGLSWETGVVVRQELPLEQVAKLYMVTRERIRQVESKALKTLDGQTLSDEEFRAKLQDLEQMNYLKDKIDILELSVRPTNILKNLGIKTVGQLVGFTEEELLRTRCMGKKSLKEIKEHLAWFDLSLREQGKVVIQNAEHIVNIERIEVFNA